MCKRILSAMLCAAMLLAMALPGYAAETEEAEVTVTEIKIDSVEDLLTLAENCRLDTYSQNLLVTLETDLDLSGVDFESIPTFSGNFLGNGHTISGLNIQQEGSNQGLFRYLTADAVVDELHVEGIVAPGGSRGSVGGIAGRNEGSIVNCSFSGTVSGGDGVGGLVGFNAVSGVIENSRVEGEIHGDHFVGGIAGENEGVIRSCSNLARINAEAQQNEVEIADITMDTLTNSESAGTVTDIGGIAGSSSGVIRSCINRGQVGYPHMGYNIGGIAGTQTGYIVDCQNYGSIQGRKEVGGVVGQMEPSSLIEYTKDTLQILQGQLSTMSGLVKKASGHAQNNAGEISNQIGVLQDQAQSARDAIDTLFIDLSDPEIPTVDAIVAAQSTLSSSLKAMPGTLNGIASAAGSTISGLTKDFEAISNQLSAMGATISNAKENLGGTITDISDEDSAETLTGKVENCLNEGNVLADLNAGGIAGAIAVENDLDILEDWQSTGEDSMSFQSQVRAVILSCVNEGTVTGKKQNVGGIIGWQSLGLVKNCENTGVLEAPDAQYVGGISGLSTGFIRSCSVKGSISGSSYVGGIAGSGVTVTDCRSMVTIDSTSEKRGAILGNAGERKIEIVEEEEQPIGGNYYYPVGADLGAIDGISYAGLAEPLQMEGFLALENLPDLFRLSTVRFDFGDGTQRRISVLPGTALASERIPQIPQKEGYTAAWEGLEDVDLNNITSDVTFHAVYTARTPVLTSQQTRDNGKALVLVEGSFTGEAAVTVTESDRKPPAGTKEMVLEVWEVNITEPETAEAVRILLPEELDADQSRLMIGSRDGIWRDAGSAVDGSYLTAQWDPEDTYLAVIKIRQTGNPLIPAAGGIAVIALLVLILRRRKKKPKKGTQIVSN